MPGVRACRNDKEHITVEKAERFALETHKSRDGKTSARTHTRRHSAVRGGKKFCLMYYPD